MWVGAFGVGCGQGSFCTGYAPLAACGLETPLGEGLLGSTAVCLVRADVPCLAQHPRRCRGWMRAFCVWGGVASAPGRSPRLHVSRPASASGGSCGREMMVVAPSPGAMGGAAGHVPCRCRCRWHGHVLSVAPPPLPSPPPTPARPPSPSACAPPLPPHLLVPNRLRLLLLLPLPSDPGRDQPRGRGAGPAAGSGVGVGGREGEGGPKEV